MIAVDSLEYLKNKTSFYDVYSSEYYQENFVKKYIADIPRLFLEVYGYELSYQQMDVVNQFNFVGGRMVVPSGHSTGKTFLMGGLALAYILLFPYSLVRIIAPKERQVTEFSFKEVLFCLKGMKSKRRYKNKVFTAKWSFLSNFIITTDKLIYINGHKKEWNIHPACAPKGQAENISGFHNPYALLMFDEASGVADDVINNSLGAMSNKINSCIMFSQHTRLSGKFHEFVTTLNKENGGVWDVIRLSSEKSPRVTENELNIWRSTYSENEYRVKVLGLPPLFENGYLLSVADMQMCYTKKDKKWVDSIPLNTIIISVDIAYTGLRDSSIITTMKATSVVGATGLEKRFTVVKNIKKFHGVNKKLPVKLMESVEHAIVEAIDKYPDATNVKVCVDATSGGTEAFEVLDEKILESPYDFIEAVAIRWGTGRLSGGDKKRFINQRAKAHVMLQEAVQQGRIFIECEDEMARVINEGSQLPFKFDGKMRYKILSKEEMKTKGINSPDIIDTISQSFLVEVPSIDVSVDEFEVYKSKILSGGNPKNSDELIDLNQDEIENESDMDFSDEVYELDDADDFDDDSMISDLIM